MNAAKTYTEREVIGRERSAFAKGHRDGANNWTGAAYERSLAAAIHAYPFPTITQPRVVADPHGECQWRVVGGTLQEQVCGIVWTLPTCNGRITPERVALWASLFASPNETVEASL